MNAHQRPLFKMAIEEARNDVHLWAGWQAFADKLVEVVSMDDDYVWLHDYHLLVLPSLLRKRFNRIRLGLFLHSPFPSSEIFRTFPRREEILRSLLNADLVGAHMDTMIPHILSSAVPLSGANFAKSLITIGNMQGLAGCPNMSIPCKIMQQVYRIICVCWHDS